MYMYKWICGYVMYHAEERMQSEVREKASEASKIGILLYVRECTTSAGVTQLYNHV